MKQLANIPLVLPYGIKEYTGSDGREVIGYEADGGKDVDGKRLRPRFSFEKCGGRLNALNDAIFWREAAIGLKAKEKREAAIPIPLARRSEIAMALEILDPLRVSLVQAARYYADHLENHRVAKEVTFQIARQKYLDFKRLEKRDKPNSPYLRNMETTLAAMGPAFDSRKMSSITAAEIQDWLKIREIAATTWNNWRRDLRVFFNFALRDENRWVNFNPAAQLVQMDEELSPVEILENKQVKELLKAAVAYKDSRQVGWLALGLFGGLRRDEADKIDWPHVQWDTDSVEVTAAKARDAKYRYVHMEPVLKAWLEWCRDNDIVPLVTKKYARREDLSELSETTGLELNRNLYRHTFGSNHVWAYRDKQRTMIEMGHTSAKTFDGYYNKPRPKMVALAYWDLTPESVLSV